MSFRPYKVVTSSKLQNNTLRQCHPSKRRPEFHLDKMWKTSARSTCDSYTGSTQLNLNNNGNSEAIYTRSIKKSKKCLLGHNRDKEDIKRTKRNFQETQHNVIVFLKIFFTILESTISCVAM